MIGQWLILFFTAQSSLIKKNSVIKISWQRVARIQLVPLPPPWMHSSSAHRHSSIDLSFEEGFSFLEAEASDSKQPTKASESHWLFDRDDALDAFLPNSPSQSRTRRLTTELIPSYAQQTFTSSLATSKKQELAYTSPATSRSIASPARRIQATPPSFRNDRESKTYTPPVDRVSPLVMGTV